MFDKPKKKIRKNLYMEYHNDQYIKFLMDRYDMNYTAVLNTMVEWFAEDDEIFKKELEND